MSLVDLVLYRDVNIGFFQNPDIEFKNLVKIRLSVLTMSLNAREQRLCISVLWTSGAVTPTIPS